MMNSSAIITTGITRSYEKYQSLRRTEKLESSKSLPSRIGLGSALQNTPWNQHMKQLSRARATVLERDARAHDAQKILQINLNSRANGKEKRILELDIEKCFDRISHSTIIERLIAPLGIKLGIFRCLKTHVNPEFSEQGTPVRFVRCKRGY